MTDFESFSIPGLKAYADENCRDWTLTEHGGGPWRVFSYTAFGIGNEVAYTSEHAALVQCCKDIEQRLQGEPEWGTMTALQLTTWLHEHGITDWTNKKSLIDLCKQVYRKTVV